MFAVVPGMWTDPPAEYETRIAALTGKSLKAAKDAATVMVQVEHEHPYETIVLTHSNIPVGVVRA